MQRFFAPSRSANAPAATTSIDRPSTSSRTGAGACPGAPPRTAARPISFGRPSPSRYLAASASFAWNTTNGTGRPCEASAAVGSTTTAADASRPSTSLATLSWIRSSAAFKTSLGAGRSGSPRRGLLRASIRSINFCQRFSPSFRFKLTVSIPSRGVKFRASGDAPLAPSRSASGLGSFASSPTRAFSSTTPFISVSDAVDP